MAASNLRLRTTPAASHLEELCEEISRQRTAQPGATLYVLIDRGMAPEVRRFAARTLAGIPHDVLFRETPEAEYADEFSPWLVELPPEMSGALASGESQTLATQLCELAQDYICVSWLWSRWNLADLAAHLRSYLSGCLWNEHEDAEEGEVFLRYFDARVLPGFIGVLSDEQRSHFLQPIECWGLWDRTLTWNVWHGASVVVPLPVKSDLFRYTLAQQAALSEHSQADRLLSRLADDHSPTEAGQRNVGGQLLVLAPDVRYRRMLHLIGVGRQLGLSEDRDFVLHAVIACCSHPRYHEHPAIARELHQRSSAGRSFGDVVARVDDAVWDALSAQALDPDWSVDEAPVRGSSEDRRDLE